jgi:hypothetical protein
VASSPPVASRISVGEVERNASAIAGLPLSAGTHDLCFSAPEGYLAPPCRTVEIRAGELTSVVGELEAAGRLSVRIEPTGLDAQIVVDGLARDRGKVLLPIGVGERRVCAEPLPGYRSPECRAVTVAAGALEEVSLAYVQESDVPGSHDDIPAPQPSPAEVTGAVTVRVEPAVVQSSKGPTWTAAVTVEARRSDGPVEGITVGGIWDPSMSATCVTGTNGRCSITRSNLHNRDKTVTFRVTLLGDQPIDGPGTTITR